MDLRQPPETAARRRALIDPARAVADVRHGAPVAGSDTVYFCVVDAAGNACSFINSNYLGFGTGIMPVAVILLASTAAMIVGSLLTRPPAAETLAKFFPDASTGRVEDEDRLYSRRRG